jgi:hypothetical protein
VASGTGTPQLVVPPAETTVDLPLLAELVVESTELVPGAAVLPADRRPAVVAAPQETARFALVPEPVV